MSLLKEFVKRICAKFLKKRVIVMMDGGICSQMHQYLIGYMFEKKGYDVMYDLSFFNNGGKDLLGQCNRVFDLRECFNVRVVEASERQIKLYKKLVSYIGTYPKEVSTEWVDLKAPLYLGGYYADPKIMYDHYFNEVFIPSLNCLGDEERRIAEGMDENSVAVHVRRGDLSTYVEPYGYPVSIDYLKKAFEFVSESVSSPVFYFFSDDPDYVESEVVNLLPAGASSVIMRTPASKGYIDLLLIAHCKHHITSKGTLGKYGALLGQSDNQIVVVSSDDKQTFMLDLAGINTTLI